MAGEPRLSDEQWRRIEELLPALTSRGRPWRGHREVLEGILWVLQSGARWMDLPPEYPSPATCWRRLQMWEEDGTWLRIWRTYLGHLDPDDVLAWEETFAEVVVAPSERNTTRSNGRAGRRAPGGWWWRAGKVFLLEASLTRPRSRENDHASPDAHSHR